MPVTAWADGTGDPSAGTPEVSTSIPTVSFDKGVNVEPGNYPGTFQGTEHITYYMEFRTDEEADSVNIYDDWIMDFTIEFSQSFTAPAGSAMYGSLLGFERLIPAEGLEIEGELEYKIIEGTFGAALTYEMIRDDLGIFPCGLVLPDAFLADNKDLIVTLRLNLYNPEDPTDVLMLAGYSFNAYTVTFEADGGTAVDPVVVSASGEAVLTAPAAPEKGGFTFGGWYKDAACTEAYDFTAPVTADMTLYAKWVEEEPLPVEPPQPVQSGGSSAPRYEVSVDNYHADNGSVKLSSSKVKKGSTVTLTVAPEEGCELDKLVVLDKNGNKVELTDKGNGRYTFKMPGGGVEVEADFVEIMEEDVPLADLPLGKEGVLVLTVGQQVYQLNGIFEANDVAPVIRNSRTMLPIRLVAEFLGAEVAWNGAEQSVTITKEDTMIVIYIGQELALVNGESVQLDAPAFIENDRTFLPLRFVTENLGAEVIWNGADSTITIYK